MKQNNFNSLMLAGVITLGGCMISSCTEDESNESASNRIIFFIDDQGFSEGKVHTRGVKVNSSSSFGVRASVYGAASSYTSAGCGSYFYNESITAGLPTEFFWPTSSYKVSFFAHYPYNNAAFTVQSAANTVGAPTYAYTVPSAIANQVDVMTGQNVNILGGGSSPVALTMKHRCSAINFSVTNNRSSSITLNSVSIEGVKYSGTLNEETWTLTSAVNSSSSNPFILSYGSSIAAGATANVTGTTNIFLMLPQTLPATAKIKLVVDNEELEATITGTWVAGRQYNYSLVVKNNVIVVVDEESDIEDWETTIDLSMVDNAGNERESMTTANCYLVHSEGKYKIPLVYGNAIKNGVANTIAYAPGAVSNGVSYFVNHKNKNITGPWITKSKDGTGVDKGMGFAVDTAELLWQDAKGMITAVGIDGDYLTFTVAGTASGNAVIAAKVGSTIVWSWHIWKTEDDLSNTTIVATGLHNYTVAPVNLGWVPTGGDGKKGYCPFYQWGRKDPVIPSYANSTTDHSAYNIYGTTLSGLIIVEKTKSSTIGTTILNPQKWYYNSDTRGPVNTTYYNLWDAQNSLTGDVATATKKTIYDPCPPGFCVPTGNLCYYIANIGSADSYWDSTNKGKVWSTDIIGDPLYFCATGQRGINVSSMKLYYVGSSGYCWSATPQDGTKGVYLGLQSTSWYKGGLNRGDVCLPIRPVAEE
jgi:hypothetical protein